jgi:predicted aspartyl protease
VERFDPKKRVPWVTVVMSGPRGAREFHFIFDTGAQTTVVNTEAAEMLGCSARMGTVRSRTMGIADEHDGYRLVVQRLEVLGFTIEQHEVKCEDFDERYPVDGLIGMDLVEGRVVTIDGVRGTISVA